MGVEVIISIAGLLASIAGLGLAYVSSVRVKDLRRRTNLDVWLGIRTAVAVIRKLEGTDARKEEPRVAEAYARAVDLYRQLLKQAVLDEKRFREETILTWEKAGKLDSEWQIAQARFFLETAAIDSSSSQEKGQAE